MLSQSQLQAYFCLFYLTIYLLKNPCTQLQSFKIKQIINKKVVNKKKYSPKTFSEMMRNQLMSEKTIHHRNICIRKKFYQKANLKNSFDDKTNKENTKVRIVQCKIYVTLIDSYSQLLKNKHVYYLFQIQLFKSFV